MPATFATFPANLAESHERRSSHRRPPRPHRRSKPPPTKQQGNENGGKLAAHHTSGKPRSMGQRRAIKPQTESTDQAGRRRYRGIAPNIKTPYRCIKMANRAYSRKTAGIHQQQRKTPHSVSHAGQGCYFWSFARSSRSNTGCNRIYNKINGGTSFQNNLRRCGHPLQRRPVTGL